MLSYELECQVYVSTLSSQVNNIFKIQVNLLVSGMIKTCDNFEKR